MDEGSGIIFIQALGFLIVFGIILFLAYFSTKLIAKKANKSIKGRNIELIEAFSIGMDKRLFLIRVGNQHLLFSSGKKGLDYVTEIDIDNQEIIPKKENTENIFDFNAIISKYIKKDSEVENINNIDNISESSTISKSSVKNNLNRLKNIIKEKEIQ